MQNKNLVLKSSIIKNVKKIFDSNPKIERFLIYVSRAKVSSYKGSDIYLVTATTNMVFLNM